MNFYTKFKNLLKKYFGISIGEWHNIAWGIIVGILAGTPSAIVLFLSVMSRDKAKGHTQDLKHDFIYFWFFFLVTELVEFLVTGKTRTIIDSLVF